MKKLFFFLSFIWIFYIYGCSSKNTTSDLKPETVKYSRICDKGPEITIDTVFTNVLGTVEKTNDNGFLLTISPTRFTIGGVLIPCDTLKSEFQHDGLKVKLSGNILRSPLQVNLQRGDIIELTSIQMQ